MPPMFGAPDYNYYDAWLDQLGRNAIAADVPRAPPPIPVWLPDIEDARKDGRILDPFEVAVQMARGE